MHVFRPVSTLVLLFGVTVLLCGVAANAWAANGRCHGLPREADLKAFLTAAPTAGGDAGGLFHGTRMWGAVVNRDGELCAITTSTPYPTEVWPGSRHIAIHKAHIGNAFSLDALALSTARLYTFVQPGHSLFGLNVSNLFETKCTVPPQAARRGGRPSCP